MQRQFKRLHIHIVHATNLFVARFNQNVGKEFKRRTRLHSLLLMSMLLSVAPQANALFAQAITAFTPTTPIIYSAGLTFALSANGGGSGNPVTFASTTTAVCTVVGSTVSVHKAGTCNITANQAGNVAYRIAPQITASVVINDGAQTIAFGALADKTYGAAAFAISAKASSGLAVSFSSSSPQVCSVSGDTVTLRGAGTCSIVASQAGNGNFGAAAQVTQSFTVAQESQTIAFAALAAQNFDATPFTLTASATSGLPVAFGSSTTGVCTVSGNTVALTGVGTCTINASQPGNTNFKAAAQVARSFTISKHTQTISFNAPAGAAYGTPVTLSGSASSGLPVSYSSSTTTICTVAGNTVTPVGIGTCTIAATQGGNADYKSATKVVSFELRRSR